MFEIGKVIEIASDVVELVLDAVSFAKTDPEFKTHWDELMSDILDLTGDGVPVVSPEAEDVTARDLDRDEPYLAPNGTLWPTEASFLASNKPAEGRTVRRITRKNEQGD